MDNKQPIIITDRLYLRELNRDDYDALYAVLADSDIMRHYPYTFDEKRVRNWIEKNIVRYRELGFGLWALCLRESGEMIGDCGLTIQNINGKLCPEIGYHLRGIYHRKGYAKEAANAVCKWAFEHTTFNRIYSYMTSDNVPSIATAKSYGCKVIDEYTDESGEKNTVCAIWREDFFK